MLCYELSVTQLETAFPWQASFRKTKKDLVASALGETTSLTSKLLKGARKRLTTTRRKTMKQKEKARKLLKAGLSNKKVTPHLRIFISVSIRLPMLQLNTDYVRVGQVW